jgi:hypothetical protein
MIKQPQQNVPSNILPNWCAHSARYVCRGIPFASTSPQEGQTKTRTSGSTPWNGADVLHYLATSRANDERLFVRQFYPPSNYFDASCAKHKKLKLGLQRLPSRRFSD